MGAVIGTGIFVLTGQAAHDKTGPALMLSFVAAGIACIFAALCYAEFASMAPVAGSAYTYAYATLGEMMAWIIGWDLILEYAVASMTVAHGWSKNFQDILAIGRDTPAESAAQLPLRLRPRAGSLRVHRQLVRPAGAWSSRRWSPWSWSSASARAPACNTAIVIFKVAIVLFVIIVGAFYVDPANWKPFAPYGYTGLSFFGKTIAGPTDAGGQPMGMLAGAAIIFFAYIGFDSVSTHAEEAKNPQQGRAHRDHHLPGRLHHPLHRGGRRPHRHGPLPGDQHRDPGLGRLPPRRAARGRAYLVSAGAVAGITSVLLVMMLSQPRVWLAMARDGMVPESFFGAVHEKYRTPWKATILTGVIVAIGAGLLPLRVLADLTNIGTLFAFVVVCAAVLDHAPHAPRGGASLPRAPRHVHRPSPASSPA